MNSKERNPGMKFGWTTCLTYETGQRRLGYDYFSRLLDEMKANGMAWIMIMIENCHLPPLDPYNHGFAWPVKNHRLKAFVDQAAINADPSSEFISKIVAKARQLNIAVYFEIKYWGVKGLQQSYPGIFDKARKADAEWETGDLHICCDNDLGHQYMRDKIKDLLEIYPDIDGMVLEHPSYWGPCACHSTKEKFILDAGKEISTANIDEVLKWQNTRIARAVSDLSQLAKSMQPGMKFALFTGFSPEDGNIAGFQYQRGHGIETLREIGLDYVMPYCEGRHKEKEPQEMERVIHYLSPLKICLHTTIRKNPPRGYPLPPKDPEYIRKIIKWAMNYAEKEPRLFGMSFFNEVNIPQENRDAVYESIRGY